MYKWLIFHYCVYFVTTLRLTKWAMYSDLYDRSSNYSNAVRYLGRCEFKILSQDRVNCTEARFREKNVYEEIYASVPITNTGEQVE